MNLSLEKIFTEAPHRGWNALRGSCLVVSRNVPGGLGRGRRKARRCGALCTRAKTTKVNVDASALTTQRCSTVSPRAARRFGAEF